MITIPDTRHHFGGKVYIKEVHVPENYVLVQHKHIFDHLSYLVKGKVELNIGGKVSLVEAPACLLIKSNIYHGIKSLEDTIWLCIHATDCEDEERVDETLISKNSVDKEIYAMAGSML